MLISSNFYSVHLGTAQPLKIVRCKLHRTVRPAQDSQYGCHREFRRARLISACDSAGTAEVTKQEEFEVFSTTDGLIEPVDDDEAEVSEPYPAAHDLQSTTLTCTVSSGQVDYLNSLLLPLLAAPVVLLYFKDFILGFCLAQ